MCAVSALVSGVCTFLIPLYDFPIGLVTIQIDCVKHPDLYPPFDKKCHFRDEMGRATFAAFFLDRGRR